jgi:benzoyl-CoA reductase subunit C
MEILDRFHDIVSAPHRFAQDWKVKTGGKVLGYICTNLPEEMMYAAGILPVRLMGTNEPENVTEPYIWNATFCSFSRDCFAQALLGRYNYIDGVVYGFCCMHGRQVFQCWQKHMHISYSYELYVPYYLQGRHAKTCLVGELEDFERSIEKWTGKSISSKDLDKAIDVYNTNRRLMLSVYDLMMADNPPITEAEALEIAVSGMLIDKQEHNRLLEQALEKLPKRKNVVGGGTRLMLLGSINYNIELVRFIDSLGAQVVVDDYCSGRRYYQTEVIPEENRLAAIASRLIRRPPCPLKDLPERRRIPYLSKIADDYRVKGVIYTVQKWCDPHGIDFPAIESLFKSKGIPMLKLEMDLGISLEYYRTRLEAFLEIIKGAIV